MTGLIHSGTIKTVRVIRESDGESGIVNFAVVGTNVTKPVEVLLFRLTVNNEENAENIHFTVARPVHRLV